MPNWHHGRYNTSKQCHNRLTVLGEKSAVDQFFEENKGEGEEGEIVPLSFSRAIPEPKERRDIVDWYGWRIHNWGTSSVLRADDIQVISRLDNESDKKTLTYIFSTAWAPPEVWLEKVASKYPDLIFCMAYGEVGVNLGGSDIYKQGILVDSSEGKAYDYIKEDEYGLLQKSVR